jgi:hypothetical protein
MPGHRDLIVEVTLGIDVVGISGKNVWSRSGTKVPDPHRVAALVEAFLNTERKLGEGLILKEGKVSSVNAGFNLIAQIARDEIQAAAKPGQPPRSRRTKPRSP